MNQEKINSLLQQLDDKYSKDSQKVEDYLEGLVQQRYTDYWDYINLDILLNLQQPKTNVSDEYIFIIYHQITELYFNLIVKELEQILVADFNSVFLLKRLQRITEYFDALAGTFRVMTNGMDREQFLQFRMSLMPASGFQSMQYRKIEFMCAPLSHLVHREKREELVHQSIDLQLNDVYWRYGGIISETGKKALTLIRFEQKYNQLFEKLAKTHQNNNLFTYCSDHWDEIQDNAPLIHQLRKLDYIANLKWPNVHYGTAVKYLKQPDGQTKGATGGTNWQHYLNPAFQKIIFFPMAWSQEEIDNWGSFSIES